MKKVNYVVLFILVLFVSSCADSEVVTSCINGYTYGFWSGIWHGMIAPFSFIGSLIWEDIAMYAPNNTGWWYDLGFILGIGSLSSSPSVTRKSKRR